MEPAFATGGEAVMVSNQAPWKRCTAPRKGQQETGREMGGKGKGGKAGELGAGREDGGGRVLWLREMPSVAPARNMS